MKISPRETKLLAARHDWRVAVYAEAHNKADRWKTARAWEQEHTAWEAAQARYRTDAPTFPIDDETFSPLCTASAAWDVLNSVTRPAVEAFAAKVLLACGTFPLRLVGERLLAWDGTVWCEEPHAVISVLRDWYDRTNVGNQYALRPPFPGKVTSRTPQADGTVVVTYEADANGYIYYPLEHERLELGEAVTEMLATWYRHPERSLKTLTEAMPLARDDANQLFREDRLGWLNTPNGVYNLEHGSDRRVTDDAERRQLAPLRVTREAVGTLNDCPKFLGVLRQALPDPAVRDYFQRLMGYAATGLVREDVVIWLLGDGNSGKTTVMGAIQHALGSYAAQNDQTALLRTTTKFPHLNELRGARLVVMSEMDPRYHIASGRMKALAGGNLVPGGPGTADWRPQFTMAIESNHMPHLDDTSNATKRRLRVIPFDVVIPEGERDTSLRDYLRDHEAAGILAWLLEGARNYYQQGLGTTPDAVKRATTLTFAQDDPECAFYEMLTPSATPTLFTTLYEELAQMCRRTQRPLPSKRVVSAALKGKGFTLKEGHARKLEVWATLHAGEDGA